jgi:hypothetical protein
MALYDQLTGIKGQPARIGERRLRDAISKEYIYITLLHYTQGYLLTQGRYLGAAHQKDDEKPFAKKIACLAAKLR